jgi:hypothetical protein
VARIRASVVCAPLRRRGRARLLSDMERSRALPRALVAIATLIAVLAMFAVWANRQLLDTESWTQTSTQLLENDNIRDRLAVFLVDELYANVDVQAELAEALPPRATALAGPAASGLHSVLQRGVDNLLGRPRVQALWEAANERAHERFLQVVEGGGEVVSTEGGDVALDLKALLESGEDSIGVGGRLAERLPEDAARLTVLRADKLDVAQDLVDFMKALAWVLLIAALGLYALAVYFARGRRREALRAVGLGLAFAGALGLVLRSLAGDALTDSLAGTESVEPAVAATWSIGTSLLQEAASATLVYGIAIVVFAWLAGPTRLAVASRRGLAPYLGEARYAWGSLAVVVLVILTWGPTPATRRLLGALLIIGLLALGLDMLRRQTAREFPDANIDEANERWRQGLSAIGARLGGTRASAVSARIDQLERLGRLRDTGVIDTPEFEREKARILETAPAGTG